MKDFIVLISTIVLGVVLAIAVVGFKDNAEKLNDNSVSQIDSLNKTLTETTWSGK